MKLLSYLIVGGFLGLAVLPVAAQWQWLDKDGRKVFSDRAPPSDIPDSSIVRRPFRSRLAGEPVAATPAPAVTSPGAASGADRELQEKKKQAEKQASDADAAKRKADEERLARAQAENCARARSAKSGLDSGVRMARTNEKGEREFFDDAMRAEEAQRLQGIIQQDCK